MADKGGSSDGGPSKTFGSWCLWVFWMVCSMGMLVAAISQVAPVVELSLSTLSFKRAEARSALPEREELTEEQKDQRRWMLYSCDREAKGRPFAADARKVESLQAKRDERVQRWGSRDAETLKLVDGISKRQMDVEISEKQVTVSRTVWLGRCSQAMLALRGAVLSKGSAAAIAWEQDVSHPRSFLAPNSPMVGIFGSVIMVSGAREVYSPPVIEEGDESDALIKVSERSFIPLETRGEETPKTYVLSILLGHWPSEDNALNVRSSKGVVVWPGQVLPTHQSASLASWKLGEDDNLTLRVEMVPVSTEAVSKSAKADAAVKPAKRPFLLRAVTGDIQTVWVAWLGVVYAVPFFLVLWWARRRSSADANEAAIVRAAQAGCLLALTLVAVLTASDVVEALASDLESLLQPYGFINLYWTAALLKAAMVGIAWPLLAGADPWVITAKRSRLAVCLTVLLLAVGAFARAESSGLRADLIKFVELLERGGGDVWSIDFPRPAIFGLVMVPSLLLASILGLWSVGRIWAGKPFRTAFLLVLAWVALEQLSRGGPRGAKLLFGAALAVPFGWAFARATYRWVPTGAYGESNTTATWGTTLVVVLAVVMALPPNYTANWSLPWLLTESSWELTCAWKWAAMALLLAWLYPRQGTDTASAEHREAGAVLLFIGFFWQPLPALSLLASAAAGVAVITIVMYAPRDLRRPRGPRSRMLAQAVRDIGLYNRLLRLRRGLQKGVQAKLDKADIEPADAMAKLEKMDQEVEIRERAAIRQRCVALLALNAGPGGDAWKRGRNGALLSSLVALPWVAWYIRAIKLGDGIPNSAVFHVFSLGISDVARWPLLGFLFMYFYPMLRGNSGIQKGGWMTGVVVLPALVATLVGAPDSMEGWSSVALWALQAFVVCMLVGVILGDFGALRLAGRRTRGIIEIYNLGTLAAWTSSLAVAVGVATTSSIADQAASFVKDRIAQAIATPATKAEAAKAEGPAK